MSEKRFTGKLLTNSNGEEFGFTIYDEDKRMNIDEVVGVLNDQQDTIFKLQDLCGKSDYENAKLRIENNELQEEIKLLKPTNVEQYEQIVQLQEENEKLRKELNDCEKFRYQVFKRMNEEYIKECSIR